MRRRSASEVTIERGKVVAKKKSNPSLPAGAFFASLGPEDDDDDVEFFVSNAGIKEAPMPSEPDEYTRFVADLTRATEYNDEVEMRWLVMQRFNKLCSEPVLRDAMAHRRETMAFVSHALNNVLILYMLPAYVRGLRARYTDDAPSESDSIDLCEPIENLYEGQTNVSTSVYGLINDLLDINLVKFGSQFNEHMLTLQEGHYAGILKVRTAKGPWIAARSVDPYDYLTRLGTMPWNTEAPYKLAFACETACGEGVDKNTPANLRDAEKIAAEWRGNLGMELVFPHGNAARCAEYNEIIFGCPARTTTKHETIRRKACAISIALRLFIKLADDHFKRIDGIDATNHFRELGVAISIAEYAFPFPLEYPLNGRNYAPMRAFIVNMIKQSDMVCRIGPRDKPDP